MPSDFSDQTSANFEEELNRARGYKPVTQKEMRQAYKQYGKVGLKFGEVKKSATDEQLYRKAERTVLKWWKLQQKEKLEHKRRKQERLNDPNRGLQSSWSGGSGGGFGGGSTGGGNYLPDTAMNDERSGAVGRGDRDKKLADITDMNPRAIRNKLRELGVPDTWNPPRAAERSMKALESWVNREAARHDLVLRANGLRAYLNDGVVREISTKLGFPINPNNIPLKKRQSHKEIRNYILMLKRQYDQATARRASDTTQDEETKRRTAAYFVKQRRYDE